MIQFFILSCNDVLNNTDNGNFNAFAYALNEINKYGYGDKTKINKHLESANDSIVAQFLSNIEVLYDWATDNNSIKVTNNVKSDKIWDPNLRELKSILPAVENSFKKLTNRLTSKQDKIEEILEGQTAVNYYYLLMPENKPTQDAIDFFILLVDVWTNSKSAQLKTSLNQIIHFINEGIKLTPVHELSLDDLFAKHIPKLISYIQTLKGKGEYKQEILLISSYADKINEAYIFEIEHKMKIYQKFLAQKVEQL